ncbi:DUF1837 domain-containing protein [Serratia ureilytica]|uniref:HamA C-terminal domain-containing protein n=1 Tax=Serratia ureilytica TaxID=300181 RepID=UPI0018D81601|nr:DUF1837 domain-containing protein [Serratia ureilytica]MBH2661241.1 DUF1837 domain-containing protein [Serratia ureilytica]MBH2703683.1 DUF1837 domain-containing protein [Serratia ureilytica]MBH2736650.1 DUF1837 domain-containing protein [Serratia ureilytica]MBJ2082965.1 DUF1837 domain-containing protein [Serratia ureilytica]
MSEINSINSYKTVLKEDYDSCIDTIEHEHKLSSVKANLRFHHFKFSANGTPMVNNVAEMLYNYIVDFCISAKNRDGELNTRQHARLVKEARNLFRHPDIGSGNNDKTGEAGEALLFFLMEAVLDAPQVVAKMELKTNSNDEVKGSDGIHIKWCEQDNVVDFYFGEAKLYQQISSAMDSALTSINGFHDDEMYKHEFSMVTKHFKYANENIRKEVASLISLGEPSENVRLNHACLIGYDWKGFNELIGDSEHPLSHQFRDKFKKDFPRIVSLVEGKFSKFKYKHLRFDVFFIPFLSVSEFRNAFNKALD